MERDLFTLLIRLLTVLFAIFVIVKSDLFMTTYTNQNLFDLFMIFWILYFVVHSSRTISFTKKIYFLLLDILTVMAPLFVFWLEMTFKIQNGVVHLLFIFIIIGNIVRKFFNREEKDDSSSSHHSNEKKDEDIWRKNNVDNTEISPVMLALIGMLFQLLVGVVLIWIFLDIPTAYLILNIDGLIFGFVGAFVPLLFVYTMIRWRNITIPLNRYTNEMKQIVKKRLGPLFLSLGPGISEEILFRIALLGICLNYFHPVYSVVVVSFIFMLVHLPQYKDHTVLNISIFIAGTAFAVVFIVTENIWTPIIAHFLYNYVISIWVNKNILKIS